MRSKAFSSAFALTALVAQVSATACSAGYHSSNGQTPCTACPAGTFQSQTGATSCTPAQAGWYASGIGNTAEKECGAGYYSTGGAAACTICPAGTYCNSNTQTSPQECEPGRYSSTPGATQDCAQCPKGTFNNVHGSTKCCSCCSGWYTDQVGQTHCFNCPNKGSYQQGYSPVGSTSSNQCIAASGALSTCTQSYDGTCRTFVSRYSSIGGSSPSQHRRTVSYREYCARPGYKSCPLWNTVQSRFGTQTVYKYECVNIASDIESCGGCVDDPNFGKHGADGGRDCTAIPNVDDVTCSHGTCNILKCSKGYSLSANGSSCVPAPHKRGSHTNSSHSHGNAKHHAPAKQ
ncbi:hypothetical protein NEOLEDRAFT_1067431 [Neolentinus lepideus HHB14362 ss-1]|uniref:Tyrosine-protein kinase ephrin type A/B receptor-like domain-containing protein n=1 Tax=Neolentinus lepideus HHB14362 ss-1 TaxID=1314782 RepID=A0A165RXP1_9AGAM|nr:hypothetical protein NEOLEDRAFT_1067431 [Neolentinus lepideus HHB14362 ss-1]